MLKTISHILYVVALFNIALGLVVLKNGRDKKTARYFLLVSFLISLWSIFHGKSITGGTDEDVLLWTRLIMVPGIFLPLAAQLFFYSLADREYRWASVQTSVHAFFIVTFVFHLFRPQLVAAAKLVSYGVQWQPGILYYVYALYFTVVMAHGLSVLLGQMRRVDDQKRRQIIYVFAGFALSIVLGWLVNIILPVLGILSFNKYGPLGTLLIISGMSYAILKHRFMDIRIVLRRTMLLLLIYGIIGIVIGLFIFSFQRNLFAADPALGKTVAIEAFLIGVFLSLGVLLYAYLIRRSTYFHEHTMAGLTHELKGPLAVIENSIEMLRTMGSGENMTADQTAYVQMIERNTAQLKGFVNDLLSVYRVKNRKEMLATSDIDLIELCRQALDKGTELAGQKNLTLSLEGEKSLRLPCDAEKITQVLSNLISNAVKFTSSGTIRLTVARDDHHATISVADSGIGIATKDLPYIFDRFYQARHVHKGAGLGLAISKAWVEAHGGKIWVESDGEGRGTTVRFTVPVEGR